MTGSCGWRGDIRKPKPGRYRTENWSGRCIPAREHNVGSSPVALAIMRRGADAWPDFKPCVYGLGGHGHPDSLALSLSAVLVIGSHSSPAAQVSLPLAIVAGNSLSWHHLSKPDGRRRSNGSHRPPNR